MLQGPGENAGVLDLGDGEAVAFKVESHNHPSAVEPFQGAATGVGGILRDIVAMGARPVALLDGLRFGEPGWKFDRAVAGIGHYGNCVGVPTVGGEAFFDETYAENCLVNAMCVGLLPVERLMSAKARTPGHLLVLYGATTGRDGIGGASRARERRARRGRRRQAPDRADRRPVHRQEADRGLGRARRAAGSSSRSRTAARPGSPRRSPRWRATAPASTCISTACRSGRTLEPWEIMISESQERMVAVVRPGFLEAVEEVCAPLGAPLHADRRGHRHRRPARLPRRRAPGRDPRRAPDRGGAALQGRADAARRGARADAARRPAARAGARSSSSPRRTSARARGSTSATTSSSARAPCAAPASARPCCGCARRCAGSPSRSTAPAGSPRSRRAPAARSPCSRRRATSPARAASRSALTDCLNFGNPEKGEIAWELAEAIEGMALRRRGARHPGRLRQRLAVQRDRRPRDHTRRRWSAASGSSPTCAPSRAGGARATRSSSPARRSCRSPGSEYQALWGADRRPRRRTSTSPPRSR